MHRPRVINVGLGFRLVYDSVDVVNAPCVLSRFNIALQRHTHKDLDFTLLLLIKPKPQGIHGIVTKDNHIITNTREKILR